MGNNDLLQNLMPLIVQYGTRTVAALALLLIAWILAGWVARIVLGGMERAKIDLTFAKFVSRMSRWLILLMAVLTSLSVFGIQTTSFATVIGAAGLTIGLAFQGSLSNFAAGVMLLIFRPFSVGDTITAAGQTGKVNEIELFTTRIDTADNRRIIVPNGAIFNSVIENASYHPTRRAEVVVGVAYGADIDRTREVLTRAALNVPSRLDQPEPAIILTGLGDSAVSWTVRVWANSGEFGSVKEALIRSVKISLDEAGIAIPYPTMDVNVAQEAR